MQEKYLAGLDYLEAITSLLQRVRGAHPTDGIYEAAELNWWWGVRRKTDELGQLFWFDDDGRPEASVVVTDFGNSTSALYSEPTMVITVMPGSSQEWVKQVVDRGLAYMTECGIEAVELEADQTDDVLLSVLLERGFQVTGDGLVECWMEATDRPEVSPLADGYRLLSRAETTDRPHHMVDSRRPDIAERLSETPLYRQDLDLVIFDGNDDVAAYGIFWFDPATATGTVEPMRTEDDHQQRGLARHVLTAGVGLLFDAGAQRIFIGFEPGNPASGPLYTSAGFEPHRQTDLLSNAKIKPAS